MSPEHNTFKNLIIYIFMMNFQRLKVGANLGKTIKYFYLKTFEK